MQIDPKTLLDKNLHSLLNQFHDNAELKQELERRLYAPADYTPLGADFDWPEDGDRVLVWFQGSRTEHAVYPGFPSVAFHDDEGWHLTASGRHAESDEPSCGNPVAWRALP